MRRNAGWILHSKAPLCGRLLVRYWLPLYLRLTLQETHSSELGKVLVKSDRKDADTPADGEGCDGAAEVGTLHEIVGWTFKLDGEGMIR